MKRFVNPTTALFILIFLAIEYSYVSSSCLPQRCENGECNGSECQCYKGFTGPTCSECYSRRM